MQTLRMLYENAHNTDLDEDTVHISMPTCPPHELITPHSIHASQTYPACSNKQTPYLPMQCTNGVIGCSCILDDGIYRQCKLLDH